MHKSLPARLGAILLLSLACVPVATITARAPKPFQNANGPAVLWREPSNIASRNLYYGAGGSEHEPAGPFTFEREDMKGSSPKFEVIDATHTRWGVKMGIEARPETAASRLLWAAGYFADEDYFLPKLYVVNLPHLHRGSGHGGSGGAVYGVRLKRYTQEEIDAGPWEWSHCPFTGTREWYGLRVLMALINNWDVKNVNNSVHQIEGANPEQRYLVSDLGASFGPASLSRSLKGDLQAYRESKWIHSVSRDYVDFNVPSAPGGAYRFTIPILVQRLDLVWVGRHIPREDARWIGDILGRLSHSQISDAFRAAGYSPEEVEGFSEVVEDRIRELQGM